MIRATSARVKKCSPSLALIEITAACGATLACTTLVAAAAKFTLLDVVSWGTRTTSRVARGAIACTISVSSTSSSSAR